MASWRTRPDVRSAPWPVREIGEDEIICSYVHDMFEYLCGRGFVVPLLLSRVSCAHTDTLSLPRAGIGY